MHNPALFPNPEPRPSLEELLTTAQSFQKFVNAAAPGYRIGSRGRRGDTPIETFIRRNGHKNARLVQRINGEPVIESGADRFTLPRWATYLIEEIDLSGHHGDAVLAWECRKILEFWDRCYKPAQELVA